MTLGEKLQNLRKKRGFSQGKLATMISVSRQAVSKWESNETTPDIGNLFQLSKIYNVSLDFLLNDEIEDANDIPVLLTLVSKEKKRGNFKWIIILLAAIAMALYIGQRFHIPGLVNAYIVLIATVSLLIALVLFIRQLISFLKGESNHKKIKP